MPLPIAHGLLGASIVAAILPAPVSVRYTKPLLAGAFLANLADFDFLLVFILHSKHWHRGFTHSIVFALFIALLFVLYLGKRRIREAAAFGLAFASHCFLDFVTTKEGGGLELLFPFSAERFVGGWFGLSELPSKLSAIEIIQALAVEVALFLPLLILILFLRKTILKSAS